MLTFKREHSTSDSEYDKVKRPCSGLDNKPEEEATFAYFNDILNIDPNKALHFAISHESLPWILSAKDRGADINQLNKYQMTFLHTAIENENESLTQILCTAGINLNAQDDFGRSAFHIAVESDNENLVRILSEAGADLNIRDNSGNSLLHLAVENNNESLVDMLCAAGADPNIQNNSKHSPLHIAFTKANIRISKILLEKGATINVDEPDIAKRLGQYITPKVMDLFVTQTKNKKNYPLSNITILEKKELNKYLDCIKKMPLPINEKIIICSVRGLCLHWWSAQIKIQDNEIKLLLIDSIDWYEDKWVSNYPINLSFKIATLFEDFKFQYSVYTDVTPRQKDSRSCSAFTLTDIKDLCKMNIYLSEYNGDIFTFLEKNTYKRTYHTQYNMSVNFTRFPLRMMRGTQYESLITEIIPRYSIEDQNAWINKKQQTAHSSFLTHIKEKIKTSPNDMHSETIETERTNFYNEKIHRKFRKIVNQTLAYIKETPLDNIEKEINKFTLIQFKKNQKSTASSEASCSTSYDVLESSELPVSSSKGFEFF